jgi:hypothetical protein
VKSRSKETISTYRRGRKEMTIEEEWERDKDKKHERNTG